jgi:multidrug efflux pump subunit AcrA (membrane-fusion protein)
MSPLYFAGKETRMSEIHEISEMSAIADEHAVPVMEAMPPDANAQEAPDISEAHTAAMAAMPPDPNMPGMPMDFGPLIDDTEDFDLTQMPPMPRRKRRLRWTAWVAIGLLVILIGAGIFVFLRSSHGTSVQYTQAAATTANLTVTVAGSGPVAANAVYNLNFSASAPITAIYVKVGERVTKGQKLAALDPTTLQDAVNQAQVTANSAATSLSEAQTNLSNAKTQQSTSLSIAQLNEQKALAACVPATTPTPGPGTPTPVVNTDATATAESTCQQLAQQQYTQAQQQANSSVTTANNQVTSAQQQLNNAETALQTAKDNLKNDVLLAPHNGLIEAVNGLIGETASGGNASGGSSSPSSSSSFIVLIDDSSLSIQAAVSEADVATIKVDQPATFTVAAYPSKTFRAIVASVNTVGASSSSVVSYTVDLAVDLQSLNGANLYAGMTATTSITTAERINTLLVPSSALSFSTTALQNGEITRSQLTSLASNGSSTSTTGSRGIAIELKAGKLVPVLVTTGLTNGQQTEILSGLKEGDEVVISQTGGTTSTTSSSSGTGGTRGGGTGGGGGGGGGFGGGN